MKALAIANMKGGVGKTTLSVVLAHAFSQLFGIRTLVVDLDAQANSSYALLGRTRYEEARGADRNAARLFEGMLAGPPPLASVTTRDASDLRESPSLGVVCSTPRLRKVERAIILGRGEYNSLTTIEDLATTYLRARLLEVEKDGFDLVLFDCPPGISIFAEAAVRNAWGVVIPTVPEGLSVLGTTTFVEDVVLRARERERQPIHGYVLFNRVEGNTEHETEMANLRTLALQGESGFKVLEPFVPKNKTYSDALRTRPPRKVQTFAQRYGRQAQLIEEVAADMKRRMHL